MQTVSRSNFTTVKTEGAILPADLLQRIAGGNLDGLQPETYHLAPNEKPNEAINRAWNRCLAVWRSFDEQRRNLAGSDTGVSLTRERWLLILFQELGYGRLSFQRRIELEDGSSYPISHLWEQTPIHLVSFRQELDRRDPTLGRSPHSLMQEFLNHSDKHMWGFVSNGLTLRLLRDNISLTRAAYLEFDLETMLTGELYADFSLLWLVCHQSRVELGTQPDAPALPGNCWLEKWSQMAAEEGTRALEFLRHGVKEAIAALGRGFLAHPANTGLRNRLNTGDLNTQVYYRELLRLVYRLIFLFVAEDRELLLLPDSDPQTRQRYTDYYSVARLRRLAGGRRGGPHPDLYRSLRRVFALLRQGYAPLGLPALGSFLFSERSTPALDEADLANTDLLNAIRALAFTLEEGVRRPVDYKNLGSEELGSVYESLLELHPQLSLAAATFELATAAGSERKTTGSYYTPTSLINCLLDSALEPVVEARLREVEEQANNPKSKIQNPKSAERAILSIKVADPACGSGHFLIAAANRLALHLARIRTGDDEPSPAARREALRDVVRHCIHGVDINEMAVELCKVALWMESLDPGKPLSFLEANIQCGNSLIGATPTLLKGGIPDEAFTPITGDNPAYCSEWKKRNKQERKGQLAMNLDVQPWDRLGDLAMAMLALDRMGHNTLAEVQVQETTYEALVRSTSYLYSRFWADAWCATFVWPNKPEHEGGYAYPITEAAFRKIERNPHNVAIWMREEVERLQERYQFFHWHLAFPHVFQVPLVEKGSENQQSGWNGGFDVVLGNPPWGKIKLIEKDFFATRDSMIAEALNAAARNKLIRDLPKSNPQLFEAFIQAKRDADGMSKFVRISNRFPLTAIGDINTYGLFAELAMLMINASGRAGIIVPTGIVTDNSFQYFFSELMEKAKLVSFIGFINSRKIFPDIKDYIKFALMTIGAAEAVKFSFMLTDVFEIYENERRFTLSNQDLLLVNPNTRTCPVFQNNHDAEITKRVYRQTPVLVDINNNINPWKVSFLRMFDMSNDSELFSEIPSAEAVALYEAKMMYQYDHRFGTYKNATQANINEGNLPQLTNEMHANPSLLTLPRYWVRSSDVNNRLIDKWDKDWLIAFRRITNNHSERTMISGILPRCGSGHNSPLIFISPNDAKMASLFISILNSFPFDFLTRQKMAGSTMNFFILEQLPVLSPNYYAPELIAFIVPHVLELTYTAWDLQPFAQDCGYQGPPFRWDEERRFLLRSELDAAYFHLYGIERDDMDYIMETFPIVKRKDEAAYGEYRTKRVILEIYDEMAEAMRTGRTYHTRLDPPPADARVAHPWDPAYGESPEPNREWVEIEPTIPQEPVRTAAIAEARESYSAGRTSSFEESAEVEPLVLRHPEPEVKKPKQPKSTRVAQETFLEVMPPPSGPRSIRLKRAMALGGDLSPIATRELVAFLADEDNNIRWLAGSSLVQRAGVDTVAAITAFLSQAELERVEQARPEALRVLGLIADATEEEAVGQAAREALAKFGG